MSNHHIKIYGYDMDLGVLIFDFRFLGGALGWGAGERIPPRGMEVRARRWVRQSSFAKCKS